MKAVLFDLDGVIADTSVYHFQAWRKLIKDNFGLDLPDELEKQTKGVSRSDSLKAILNYLNISVPEDRFAEMATEKNNVYRELLAELTTDNILPGIAKLISDLKDNQVKISLASASLNGPFILQKLNLIDYFDAIADPSKVAAGKPAPDIFIAAAQAVDLNPKDCVGIEDSIAGITAINQSGALSVGVGSKDELSEAKLLFPGTSDLDYKKIENAWEQFQN